MNRVTIVNLAGRAWHLESTGVESLERWLRDARTRLEHDPDRDELVEDFERAIADRFEAVAPGDRDVVTTQQVDDVLTALGPVEPATTADDGTAPSTDLAQPSSSPRRLYRLTGDDAMLGGVCAGVAAYLNVDVTVVRVVAVLLAFLTSGAMLLVYVAMWLLVPEAASPQQRADARGSGQTAEEMLARARVSAGPALATLGSTLARILVVIGHIVRWSVLIAIWALLVAWGLALGWLVLDPEAFLSAFDPGTSNWIVGLWITCIAWVPLAVLIAIERLLAYATGSARGRTRATSIALTSVLAASLVLAGVGTFAIPANHSEDLSGLSDGRGTVEMFGYTLCADDERSHVTDDDTVDCDEYVDVDID